MPTIKRQACCVVLVITRTEERRHWPTQLLCWDQVFEEEFNRAGVEGWDRLIPQALDTEDPVESGIWIWEGDITWTAGHQYGDGGRMCAVGGKYRRPTEVEFAEIRVGKLSSFEVPSRW